MTADMVGPEPLEPAGVRHRLEVLAEELIARGDLRTDSWRQVLTTTYRHLLVPRYYVNDNIRDWRSRWRVIDGGRPEQRDEWLDAVYRNQTLVTDLKDQIVPAELGGGTSQIITSSSTLPGLVVRMLEMLDVCDGDRVLEIGTGAGYNAALLCGRLGDRNVTSIDIDPDLVVAARGRLAAHGFHPRLIAGDGANRILAEGPYDRVIATCSVDRIPYAWVEHTRAGGAILANLRGELMRGALVRLVVRSDRTASGPFQFGYAAFMELRRDPTIPYVLPAPATVANDTAVDGRTDLDPRLFRNEDAWSFFAPLAVPGIRIRRTIAADDTPGTQIVASDGSWAVAWHTLERGRYPTTQGGPRQLWDELEIGYRQWVELGQPGWERFAVTVTPSQQWISLDEACDDRSWPLPGCYP